MLLFVAGCILGLLLGYCYFWLTVGWFVVSRDE